MPSPYANRKIDAGSLALAGLRKAANHVTIRLDLSGAITAQPYLHQFGANSVDAGAVRTLT
jgi:hypothetical protein